MHELNTSTAIKTIKNVRQGSGSVVAPMGVSCVCHACKDGVVFNLSNPVIDQVRLSVISTGPCPSCMEKTHFIYSVEKFSADKNSIHNGQLYVFPSSSTEHEEIEIPSTVPPQLTKAYSSVVESFNSKNYIATAAGCRRTLEGVFKLFLEDSSDEYKNKSLYKIIEKIADSTEINEPLRRLSHAIREGGNLGAHYEIDSEPDRATAEAMVYLLEYLITYMYVLGERINEVYPEQT